MSRDVFAESLHKDGVVVRVVLLASCEEIRLEKMSEEKSGETSSEVIWEATVGRPYLVHPLNRSLEGLKNRREDGREHLSKELSPRHRYTVRQ